MPAPSSAEYVRLLVLVQEKLKHVDSTHEKRLEYQRGIRLKDPEAWSNGLQNQQKRRATERVAIQESARQGFEKHWSKLNPEEQEEYLRSETIYHATPHADAIMRDGFIKKHVSEKRTGPAAVWGSTCLESAIAHVRKKHKSAWKKAGQIHVFAIDPRHPSYYNFVKFVMNEHHITYRRNYACDVSVREPGIKLLGPFLETES